MSVLATEELQADRRVADAGVGVWLERRTKAKNDRKKFELDWQLAVSYLQGHQWLGVTRDTRKLASMLKTQKEEGRQHYTVNLLERYLWAMVGKLEIGSFRPHLYSSRLDPQADAYTDQTKDAFEYAWDDEIEAEERLLELFLHVGTYGLGAIWAGVDATGPLVAENVPWVDGKPVLDPDDASATVIEAFEKGSKLELRPMREAQLSWEVASPFNILVPPGLTHERKFPWFMLERAASVEEIESIYGKKVGPQALQSNDLGINVLSGAGNTTLEGQALITTAFELPTRNNPKGREITFLPITGEKLADSKALRYEIKGRHYTGVQFFKFRSVPGRFWPVGLIQNGIVPQHSYNRSRSQHRELTDRNLGRVYAEKGTVTVANNPIGLAMELVEIEPGRQMPQETTGPGPGPWIRDEAELSRRDIEDAISMSDTSLGQAPPGISAFATMTFLAEQDDKKFGPIIKHFRRQIRHLTAFGLHDMKTWWMPDKHIVMSGPGQEFKSFEYNATSIDMAGWIVKVGSDTALPQGPTAEVQKIYDVFDRAISTGRPLPVSWLHDCLMAGKLLELPKGLDEVHTEKARMENVFMAQGQPVNAGQFDDDLAHMQAHQIYRTQLDAIAVTSPQEIGPIIQMLDAHMGQHIQASQAKQANLQGLQGAQPALPPSPGAEPAGPIPVQQAQQQ